MTSDDLTPSHQSWVIRIAGSFGLLPALMLVWFGPVVTGSQRFAFRDVSHFFTPLYGYLSLRSLDRWLPLWNPLDQTGVPILGESTTALLYPIRWFLGALPVSLEHRMSLYCVVHLMIAALGARWAVLRWIRSRQPSSDQPHRQTSDPSDSVVANLGGLVYAGSGTVIFLVCNPPFLAGAAWLPFALTPFVVRSFSIRTDCIISGFAMAMMVLAGDPQTALHTWMIGWFTVLAHHWKQRSHNQSLRWQNALFRLFVPVMIASVLAMPQIIGSLRWARQSERLLGNTDHSQSWWQPPRSGSKRQEAFQFSFPPWHTWEIISPLPFGSRMPQHQRWSAAIPGDGRMWTATIYAGFITGLGFLMGLCLKERIWWWIGLGSLLTAFGHFGGMWVIQNVTGQGDGFDSTLGGIYGTLYHWFPGYSAFRYPAKWLPIFAFAAAMLTAQWLLVGESRAWKILRRASLFLCVSHISIWILSALGQDLIQRTIGLHGVPRADEFWGPFELEAARKEHLWSVLHTSVIAAIVYVAARWRWNRQDSHSPSQTAGAVQLPPWCAVLMLALTLTELSGWQRTLIPRLSVQRERDTLGLLSAPSEKAPSVSSWMRTKDRGQWPALWESEASAERVLEVETTARRNWWTRWHLLDGVRVFNSPVSVRSQAIAEFWKAADFITKQPLGSAPKPNEQPRLTSWSALRSWLGVGGTLQVSNESMPLDADQELHLGKSTIQLAPERPLPLQLSVDYLVLDETEAGTTPSMRSLMFDTVQRVVLSGGDPKPRVFANVAKPSPPQKNSAWHTGERPSVRVLRQEPELFTAEVHSDTGGLLHRSVYQDGEWLASWRGKGQSTWQAAEVRVVDGLRQGVILPAGDLEVQFRYQPWWLPWTLAISCSAWLACGIAMYRQSLDDSHVCSDLEKD